MSLLVHEFIHIVLSLLIGFLTWYLFNLRSNIYHLRSILFGSFLGGVFVDLDHFFEYFLAFGLNFRFDYFFKGYQFLKLGKLYIPFHSWELVILLSTLIFILSRIYYKKSRIKILMILFSFTFALFFHLIVDTIINHVTFQGYSFLYRMSHNFDIKYFVDPEHYQDDLKLKKEVKL